MPLFFPQHQMTFHFSFTPNGIFPSNWDRKGENCRVISFLENDDSRHHRFRRGTQSSPDSQSTLEDLCILAFCGRSWCKTSLCALFDPVIIKIFCSFSICLFSISLVTFSVIQSSMDDWKEKARGHIATTHSLHTHTRTLYNLSLRKRSVGHFIISFHFWRAKRPLHTLLLMLTAAPPPVIGWFSL